MKGETTPSAFARGAPRLSAIGELVRRHDRDRYQTALFAPADRREALFALYAFNYEIARVRESVTQPMLGQIRLQWWREVIDAAFAGGPTRQHEVAAPLTRAIRDYGLGRGLFDRMIDTREQDIAEEPPASMAVLVGYAEATSSTLVELALMALGVVDASAAVMARDVGIAYALAGLLRAMPFHARSGRRYVPQDIAASAGFDPADYAARRPTPALRSAVSEIAAIARRHVDEGRRQYRSAPPSARAALLPVLVARRFLMRLKDADHDPFAAQLQALDPLQSWRLGWAMLTGRL